MQFTFWEPADTSDDDAGGDDCDWRECRAKARGGEFLVAADLSMAGMDCFFAAEGSRYDLVAECDCHLWKVQVKTTFSDARQRLQSERAVDGVRHGYGDSGYTFGFGGGSKGRGDKKSKRGTLSSYSPDEVDIFAFVTLDKRLVIYTANSGLPIRLFIPATRFRKDLCDLSREQAFRGLP